jgi:predicted transcriptional regulator
MPAPKPPDTPFLPNLYVVARFLDALSRPEVVMGRSQLQAAVGVNYDVLRRYLEFLERKGYVTIELGERGADAVRLTAEGRRVRDELRSWLAEFLAGSDMTRPPRPQTLKDEGPSFAPP